MASGVTTTGEANKIVKLTSTGAILASGLSENTAGSGLIVSGVLKVPQGINVDT